MIQFYYCLIKFIKYIFYYEGANPDLIDTNGNTVTHIMVIHDNMMMFDLAVECGGTIATRNNLNLNPLTVAAYLAHKDMFFHIANIEREVYWQIGKYKCIFYIH